MLFAFPLLVGGCAKPSEAEDFEPAVLPKTVTFEGKADARFVGVWTSEDKSSTLELIKDGSLKIGMVAPSPKGPTNSHYKGEWLVSKGDLLLRYADTSGADTILKYKANLQTDKLVLAQEGGRLKTTYKKG